MKKFFKILLFVIGGIILLGALLPDVPKEAGATAATPNAAGEVAAAPVEESKPDLEILKTDETLDEISRTIHVKVRNNTDRLISYVDLKGVYYDKKKNVVGTGLGNAVNIAAGATKTIDIMSMGIEGADSYEVELGNVLKD